MASSYTTAFGTELEAHPEPELWREIHLPGNAGFGLKIRRHVCEIEITPMDRAAIYNHEAAGRLVAILEVFRKEIDTLRAKTPEAAAAVDCVQCGDEFYTSEYQPLKEYRCVDGCRG